MYTFVLNWVWPGGAMTDDKEKELPQQPTQDQGPRCPTCAGFPRLLTSILQPRSGKTVKLFRCDCGERIWND
jgi:hypothetical protein